MGFTIAYTSIAEEMGLTETEKGIVFSSIFYGVTVAQVKRLSSLVYIRMFYATKNSKNVDVVIYFPTVHASTYIYSCHAILMTRSLAATSPSDTAGR